MVFILSLIQSLALAQNPPTPTPENLPPKNAQELVHEMAEKKLDPNLMAPQVIALEENLRKAHPFPLRTLRDLEMAMADLTLAQADTWTPGPEWKNWLRQGKDVLGWTGRMETFSRLAQKVPESVRQSDVPFDLTLTIGECNFLKTRGKTADCEKKLDVLSKKISPEQKMEFDIANAQLLADKGDQAGAIAKISPYLKGFSPVLNAARPWIRLLLSYFYINAGQVAESKKYLDMHLRQLGTLESGEGSNPLSKLFGRVNLVNYWRVKGDPKKAQTEALGLLQEIDSSVSGVSTMKSWIQMDLLLIAGLQNKKSQAVVLVKELQNTLKELPDDQWSATYIAAFEEALKGNFQPQQLEPARKLLGSKYPPLIRTQNTLQKISALNKAKPAH